MAWWDSSGLSSFATQALKSAQKSIDKVLDIEVEEGEDVKPSTSGDTAPSAVSVTSDSASTSQTSASGAESDGFWNAWLSPTAGSSSKLSTSLSQTAAKKKESKSKDRSLLKGKLGLGKKLRPTLSVEIPSSQPERPAETGTSKAASRSSITEDADVKVVEKLPVESKMEEKSVDKELQLKTDNKSSGDRKHDSDLSVVTVQSGVSSVKETEKKHSVEPASETASFEGDKTCEDITATLHSTTSSDSPLMKGQTDTSDTKSEGFTNIQSPEKSLDMSAEVSDTTMDKSSGSADEDGTGPIEGSYVLSTSGWSDASFVAVSEQQSEEFDSCKELDTKSTGDLQTVGATSSEGCCVGHTTEEAGSGLSSSDIEEAEPREREDREETGRMQVSVAPVHTTVVGDDTEHQDEDVTKTDVTDTDDEAQGEASDEMVTVIDDGSSHDELSESNRTLTSDDHLTPEEPDGDRKEGEESDGKADKDATSGPGQTLSSSSYVKDLLEEAMVESVKDSDSKASSTSSCNARNESGQNSGQTSADEIDTTTSSDIEIISHISTPTLNGDNNGQGPFDLSPLRHALSRGFPRGSSSGHARSDSSSSSTSKNGDESSPDGMQGMQARKQGRGTRTGGEGTEPAPERSTEADDECPQTSSQSEDMEKLLKAPEPNMPLQPIPETTDLADSELGEGRLKPLDVVDTETIDPSYLLERLASMAEVLDARERKLVELSKENIDLEETTNILRTQLQQCEEAREAEMADLNQLTDEFTERLSEAESRLQKVIREKDTVKKKLHDAETEFAKGRSTEKLLREKDQQISELLMEGEKLSKQQLQNSNVIKKLRTKDKENDSLLKSLKQKTDDQKAEIEHLHEVLDSKIEMEKKQADAIKQLNDAVVKQEQELSRVNEDLEDSKEKMRSMQVTLDHSYKELAELQKMDVARQSRKQEEALSAEMQKKEEMRLALERAQMDARHQYDSLVMQIDDLRLSLTRQEREHAHREEMLKQEISDLQQRLQEADDRNQELTQNVSAATRPLLRQVENLQATHSAQIASYERVERNLTDRLGEAQVQLAAATEKERAATEQMMEVTSRISTLESQVATLRQEKCRLQANLEMEQTKADLLQETKINDTTKLEMAQQALSKENRELKKDNMMLENQLEVEKMKTESEKKKLVLAHETLRDKEMQLAKMSSWSPSSRRGSVHSESSMSQDEMLERTLMATVGTNGNKMSLYDSLRQSGATTLLENLQSQLKQRDGEITQLQSEIAELERTRESMAKELVNLTTKNDQLEEKLDSLVTLQQQYKALDKRYNALLQMYGEKVEQAQELSLDLQDMKELYKSQIDELLQTPATKDE